MIPGNFHFGALSWRHGTSCRLGWWMHGERVEERWWWRLEAKDYWYGRLWLQFVGAHADFVVVVDDDVLHAVHVLHCMTLMLALLLLWRLLLFQPAMVIIRNSKQSITKGGGWLTLIYYQARSIQFYLCGLCKQWLCQRLPYNPFMFFHLFCTVHIYQTYVQIRQIIYIVRESFLHESN